MAYPRQIELSESIKEKFISQIDRWILDHRQERGEWSDQLITWQEDYDATPIQEQKDFPFKDSCSIIIPLTAIAVETNHAALMGTIFPAGGQYVSVKGMTPEAQNAAPVLQRFVNDQLVNHIDLRKGMESSFLELEKFGTGVARGKYSKITKYGIREVGGVEVEFPVVIKNNVEVESIPLANFWMPFNEQDPQCSPYVATVRWWTPEEVQSASRDGLLYEDAFEKLEGRFTSITSDEDMEFQENQENLEKRSPSLPKQLKIFEIWCAFDVDGTDIPKEVQVFYCEEVKDIVGLMYNQSPVLARPFRHGNYIKVEHRWAGIGICKQNEQFQIEVTVQHRQRIDNATLANLRMFKVAKMSGYGPNEPVFPGKMWFLDDMNDIEPLQLGEIYPSAYSNEQQTLLYSQQRVGVNENTMGMPAVGTPGTATSDIARLQEAKKKFDYVINNTREFTYDVVLDCLDLIKQNGIRHSYIKNNQRDSAIIESIFSANFDSFREITLFDIQLIGSQTNKVLDRQNLTQVTGYLTQYYTQMIQLAMQSQNPQLLQLFMQKAVVGGTDLMRQILETFDIQNIENILPVMEILQMNGGNGINDPQGGNINGPQGNLIGSGNPGASVNNQLGGMGGADGLPFPPPQ